MEMLGLWKVHAKTLLLFVIGWTLESEAFYYRREGKLNDAAA